MSNLVKIVKEKTGLSGNKIAHELGVSPELVSGWNLGKYEPNGLNTLKLVELSKMKNSEAIKLMQGGNASITQIFVLALLSIALLAPMLDAPTLYIMLNKRWTII